MADDIEVVFREPDEIIVVVDGRGLPGRDGTDGNDGLDGNDGITGKSTYEVWLTLPGNSSKTEEDFFQWLADSQAPLVLPALQQAIEDGLIGELPAATEVDATTPEGTTSKLWASDKIWLAVQSKIDALANQPAGLPTLDGQSQIPFNVVSDNAVRKPYIGEEQFLEVTGETFSNQDDYRYLRAGLAEAYRSAKIEYFEVLPQTRKRDVLPVNQGGEVGDANRFGRFMGMYAYRRDIPFTAEEGQSAQYAPMIIAATSDREYFYNGQVYFFDDVQPCQLQVAIAGDRYEWIDNVLTFIPGNKKGTVFGGHSTAVILPGADGQARVYEYELHNFSGTPNKAPSNIKNKQMGQWVAVGGVARFAGHYVARDGGSIYQMLKTEIPYIEGAIAHRPYEEDFPDWDMEDTIEPTVVGSISGSTMTVTSVTYGKLHVGMVLSGSVTVGEVTTTLVPGTILLAQFTGTPGGVGTYGVSAVRDVPSTIIKANFHEDHLDVGGAFMAIGYKYRKTHYAGEVIEAIGHRKPMLNAGLVRDIYKPLIGDAFDRWRLPVIGGNGWAGSIYGIEGVDYKMFGYDRTMREIYISNDDTGQLTSRIFSCHDPKDPTGALGPAYMKLFGTGTNFFHSLARSGNSKHANHTMQTQAADGSVFTMWQRAGVKAYSAGFNAISGMWELHSGAGLQTEANRVLVVNNKHVGFGGLPQVVSDGPAAYFAYGAPATNVASGIAIYASNVDFKLKYRTSVGEYNVGGADKATATELRSLTVDDKYVSPKTIADAMVFTTLADAATIDVDLNTGINFVVTLAGNRILAAPTNTKPGQTFTIDITNTGGNRTLTFSGNYKFAGGTIPTLSTGAGAWDQLICRVRADGAINASLTKGWA